MRALVVREYGPIASHRLEDLPEPQPGPGQVVIETHAMSVNFPDVLLVQGLYQHRPEPPVIVGFDCAGIVRAVGPGVTRVAPGQRVFAYAPDGAFAERALVPEAHVYAIPEGKDFEAAAAFGLTYLTAQTSLVDNAGAQKGETVLVTGASGGVGLATLQYGRALGMRMIAGVTSKAKGALAMANGADATVDLAAPDLRNALRDQVRALTDGQGVDLVIDVVGGDVFDASLRAIRYGGRIAIVGFAGGRIPEIKANYLLIRKITAIGSPLGTYSGASLPERDAAMAKAVALWAEGKLEPQVTEVHRLEDWQIAFSRFERREVTGKIVLIP